jgi:hypothetical protein
MENQGSVLVEDSFAAHDHFHMRFASVTAQARILTASFAWPIAL